MALKVLHVDLGQRESWIEILDLELELFLGGRSLASYLLHRNISSENKDALSPENPLIFSPGLLVGTGLPTASKSTFSAKSPQTGFLGRSVVGAHMGWQLKKAGLDSLVIHGELDSPGILVLKDEKVEVVDAGELWGKLVSETHTYLAEKYRGFSSCVIGPAGENLSRIASIDCNGRQAGRTGLGAVMGSKKLKAILIRGDKGVSVAYPDKLRELIKEWAIKLPRTDYGRNLMEYGTPSIIKLTEAQGVFPSLNWRRSTLKWCGKREELRENLAIWESINRTGRNPCPHCNRPCSQVVKAMNPFGGGLVDVDGPEYEVLYSLGSNIGLCDPRQIATLSYAADELGFDAISLGGTIAWAIELAEKELLGDYIKGYEGLSWGATSIFLRLIRDMAYKKEGLGELLSDGVLWAVKKFRWGMDEAIHVKGLELPAYDARGLKGLALGYAVSSRGGDHLTSGMYALELGGKLWMYEKIDPLKYDDKPVVVAMMEDLFALHDALGICKFSRYELLPSELAKAVNAVTGLELREDELILVGERTITLERILNIRFGLKPGDDTLPPRILYQPITDGPRKGELVDVYEFEKMKKEYYRLRGWNGEGIPYKETIIKLGLASLGVGF